MSAPSVSLLIVLAALLLLCRPYLEARRPPASLALLIGLALGPSGAALVPPTATAAAGPLAALAAGWLALAAAEAWDSNSTKRLFSIARVWRLLIPAALVAPIGAISSAALAVPLACLALSIDPDAVRYALGRTPRPDPEARLAPSVAGVALGLALLGSLLFPIAAGAEGAFTRSAAALPLGAALGMLWALLARLAEGKDLLLVLLAALPLAGWGLAAWAGAPPLAVVFLAGIVLANERTKRDLIFTLAREHERFFTLLLLAMAGASLPAPRAWLGEPAAWLLILALVVLRPLGWRFTPGIGMRWALPMSPLALPLAASAAASAGAEGLGGPLVVLPAAAAAAFVLGEAAWHVSRRERAQPSPSSAGARTP